MVPITLSEDVVMALFSSNSISYSETDKYIRSYMEYFYEQCMTINQSFWQEANIDSRFYAGDQSVWNEYYNSTTLANRFNFSFNRIKPIVSLIEGYQARNRKSTVVVPLENADDVTADQYTKLLMWNDQQEGVLETITEAFRGALITGMNLLQVWMDYREDPVNGTPKVDNCSFNSFLIDPYFRKADLSDCRTIWKRSFLTRMEIASLLPGSLEKITSFQGSQLGDEKFQFMPEQYDYNMRDLLTYDEFYYRDYRKAKIIIDKYTGINTEWKGTDEDLRFFLEAFPQIAVDEADIPTTKVAVLVQGNVMYNGYNPMGIDEFPFVPVMAYYQPELTTFAWRIQGVVRGLRDPQYLYNRRKVIECDILESQLNSGFFAKENAVVNPKDLYKTGQGQVIFIKEDAQMTDIQQIQPSNVSPGMLAVSEQLQREMYAISGANEELMGAAIDDKAGVLSMLRQGAGLTSLQRLFDQLDRSQKLLGKIRLNLFQANFTPGKVQRILNEKPADQFYKKAFGKYDVAIEEGLNTTTQRQMQFAQLLQLKEVGVNISQQDLINAATIQGKNKIIENMLNEQQQAAQAQQAQAQAAMQLQQAQMNMANARAMADQGLAIERTSRVEENRAAAFEREAEAYKDNEMATLNLVKAIKELQSIDIAQLQQVFKILESIKGQQSYPQPLIHENNINTPPQEGLLQTGG